MLASLLASLVVAGDRWRLAGRPLLLLGWRRWCKNFSDVGRDGVVAMWQLGMGFLKFEGGQILPTRAVVDEGINWHGRGRE